MLYPLRILIQGLATLVERLEGEEDPACLDLLAAAWVAAVDLRDRGGITCGTVGRRRPEPIGGLDEALREIRAADRDEPGLAYASLVRALLGIERVLTDAGLEPDARGTFRPGDLWPAIPGMTGVVSWWLRPRSLWSRILERDERATTRQIYGLPPRRLLRRIGFDWDRAGDFGEVAGCDPSAGDHFERRIERVEDRPIHLEDSLRVVLHPLRHDLWPWFLLVERSGSWVVDVHRDRFNDAEAVEQVLTEAVVAARTDERPQLLVFPELMVDGPARSRVTDALRREGCPVLATFAGSAHLTLADGRGVSQALVLDPSGRSWWTHHKRGSYRCNGRTILAARAAERMFVPQDVEVDAARDYHEAFTEGSCLRFADTALGRLLVLICSDVLDDAAWASQIDRLEPDFLVIVSMSDRAGRFLDRAHALALERRISTLYVNAACEARPAADPVPDRDVLAFVELATDDAPDRPSRVCWRAGRGLERWDRGPERWVPFEAGPYGIEAGAMWCDVGAFLHKR